MFSGILINLVVLVFGALVSGLNKTATLHGYSICTSFGYTVIEAKFGEEQHLLCLKLQPLSSSHLTTDLSAVLLDPDQDVSTVHKKGFALEEVSMANGFPVFSPNSGSAEGYIGEDNHFYGVLHLGNRTLHADPYGTDDPKRIFGAFEHDNVDTPRPRRYDEQFGDSFRKVTFPFNIEGRQRPPGVARARICDLLLLADKEFYEKDCNASLHHVVRRMMHAVAQADIVFRNADFDDDGMPDNIGFAVKYILVLTSNETNTRVFGNLLNVHTVDGRSYLMQFARLRRLSEVCLGVAFSGHAFLNRTLGLSFTSLGGGEGGAAGGLCDRRAYGRSFNTLAMAHSTPDDSTRVPERIAALTLAHELGHSFGAHHDDTFPDLACRGFLMGSQSSNGSSASNFEFSICSKRLIAATLSSMSYCLSEEDRPYCGNGIVEQGEVCDCGLPSRCADRDPCCTPRAGGALLHEDGTLHKSGCSVSPVMTCHPSQGPCCTKMCQFADLSESGIDCRNLGKECSCNSSSCSCGLGGRCWRDGSCHASECVTLGLRECQCDTVGMQGTLNEYSLCGVCCEVEGPPARCVAAEVAAQVVVSKEAMPEKWVDDEYRGPNVTFHLCANCNPTMIRAWKINSRCVTQNTVGVCSIRGVCQTSGRVPRSNVYPELMQPVKLGSRLAASDAVVSVPSCIFVVVLLSLK